MKTLEQIAAEAAAKAFTDDGYWVTPRDAVERYVLVALREATRPIDPPVSPDDIDRVWEAAGLIPQGMTELRDRYEKLRSYVEYLERQNAMLMREPEGVIYQQGRADGMKAFWDQPVGAVDWKITDGLVIDTADPVSDFLT